MQKKDNKFLIGPIFAVKGSKKKAICWGKHKQQPPKPTLACRSAPCLVSTMGCMNSLPSSSRARPMPCSTAYDRAGAATTGMSRGQGAQFRLGGGTVRCSDPWVQEGTLTQVDKKKCPFVNQSDQPKHNVAWKEIATFVPLPTSKTELGGPKGLWGVQKHGFVIWEFSGSKKKCAVRGSKKKTRKRKKNDSTFDPAFVIFLFLFYLAFICLQQELYRGNSHFVELGNIILKLEILDKE